jgi:hypothetical protein
MWFFVLDYQRLPVRRRTVKGVAQFRVAKDRIAWLEQFWAPTCFWCSLQQYYPLEFNCCILCILEASSDFFLLLSRNSGYQGYPLCQLGFGVVQGSLISFYRLTFSAVFGYYLASAVSTAEVQVRFYIDWTHRANFILCNHMRGVRNLEGYSKGHIITLT